MHNMGKDLPSRVGKTESRVNSLVCFPFRVRARGTEDNVREVIWGHG